MNILKFLYPKKGFIPNKLTTPFPHGRKVKVKRCSGIMFHNSV